MSSCHFDTNKNHRYKISDRKNTEGHMYFANTFEDVGFDPVLAYMKWTNGKPAESLLFVSSARATALAFAGTLPFDRKKEVRDLTDALSESNEEPDLLVTGPIAQTLGNVIGDFMNNPADLIIPDIPQLCGFYQPNESAPDDAAFIWFEPGTGHHIAVVYSQQQGIDVVESFDWMNPEDSDGYLKEIKGWRMKKSAADPLIVGGSPARLISCAQFVRRGRSQIRSSVN